jgi:hypothetical protein
VVLFVDSSLVAAALAQTITTGRARIKEVSRVWPGHLSSLSSHCSLTTFILTRRWSRLGKANQSLREQAWHTTIVPHVEQRTDALEIILCYYQFYVIYSGSHHD